MKRNYYIVALILLTFFVISFITNIFGPLTPEIKNGFNLNYTLTAILYFAFFIAYGVMSIPAGMLIEKYNEKKMMIVSFLVVSAGSLLFALYPDYFIALPSLFVIGCGFAILQVVINPLLRTAGGEEHYAFNSVLAQLIFGGASFLSPLVYKYVAESLKKPESNALSFFHSLVPEKLPWVSLYWIFAAIGLLMVIVVAFSKFPKVELKEDEKAGVFATHIMLFKNKVVVLFFLGIICYVGTEQGIANNISQFLFAYHGYNPEQAGADAVAYFWGLMTAGGILGLLLLKIMDSRKVLIIFTILALTSLSAALFGPAKISLYAFPAVGFFASVMYPIIFSLALNSIKEHHGSFSGILCTGIIGGAIVPLIIGWFGDLFGLRTGMFFLYLTMGYILLIGFWAKPIIANKTIFDKKEAVKLYE
ncbi:sugar MFS transporter [Danxiaibacter flavus]|uniref:Sugar MFS transporter n=1 Tax=Danxiaibacter flavus TaxID=3049108 RepID=A0ABV3ZD86_9BACT|nr:sugar MFS transporter [Chitinophagaceae bacterium DXS]